MVGLVREKKQQLSHRITLKLALCLVVLSSLFTVLGTVAQVYMDCREDLLKMTVLAGPATARGDQPLSSGTLERGEVSKLQIHGFGDRVVQILLTNGIKIFLLAGCSLLLFHYFVIRHLESLARQIGRLDFANSDSRLTLCRKDDKERDELDAVVSGLNITLAEARQTYKTLVKNEQRLLLFFDSTEESIVGVDRDGICTFVNDACLHLLAKNDYEAAIGLDLHTLFRHTARENRSELDDQDLVGQAMVKGQALQCEDGCITLPSGKILLVAIRAYPVFMAGKISGALIFINDNSEKRQLRRDRELLSEAIEQVPVMIIIADSDQRIQYANSGAERLTGYTRQELVHQSIFLSEGIFVEGDTPLTALKNSLHHGQQWEGILETRSKWGKPLKFFSVISPVFDDRNQVVNLISVSREVSCEIALQNEVINTKKMEAVGRLSASFVHEFGNPLFGVRAVLRDICDRVVFSEADKYLLELAHGECERMRSMVRELQQLDRQAPVREENHQLPKIITDVLQEAEPFLKAHNIEVLYEFPDNTREIVVNKSKVSVVVRNIVFNAAESMAADGGRLRLSTALEGDFLKIFIGDTGGGIKKEHQELIFEPFFSTKPEVEGKGLGLSVAYGTVRGLGGTLTFATEEGKGTVFIIHLPVGKTAILHPSAVI